MEENGVKKALSDWREQLLAQMDYADGERSRYADEADAWEARSAEYAQKIDDLDAVLQTLGW